MAILQFFLYLGPKIFHKKIQVISSKNECVMAIFANFDFLKIFFQTLKFKVWSPNFGHLTLLGAQGPQQSPRGPEGPPALRRS